MWSPQRTNSCHEIDKNTIIFLIKYLISLANKYRPNQTKERGYFSPDLPAYIIGITFFHRARFILVLYVYIIQLNTVKCTQIHSINEDYYGTAQVVFI